MSYKKTTIHITGNMIFLRFQIAQDYWTQIIFTFSKSTQNKNIYLKKKKQQIIEVWEILSTKRVYSFSLHCHEQKYLIICSYLY